MTPLASYVAAALLAWSPAKDHAPDSEATTRARYDAIAVDIASVVEDPAEPALFKNDPAKAETAIQLAGVAFFESRFWTWVGDGTPGQLEPKNASPAVAVDGRAIVLGYGVAPRAVDVRSGQIEDVGDSGFGELGNPSVAPTGTEVVVWGGLDPAGRATAGGWSWRPGG